jgi:hypothetical protein
MAKRTALTKRSSKSTKSPTLMEAAEHAVLRRSNQVLVAATKRYKQFVRQASKATNTANKKKYLGAALTAVIIAGVVAKDLKSRIDKRSQVTTARKRRS